MYISFMLFRVKYKTNNSEITQIVCCYFLNIINYHIGYFHANMDNIGIKMFIIIIGRLVL